MDKHEISGLLSRTDLRTLIEQDLGQPRRRSGQWWSWGCPFHQERTAGGFQVTAERYKCFSCGASGDAISWLREIRKITFQEAIKVLGGGPDPSSTPAERAEQAARLAETAARQLQEQIESAQKVLAELRQAQAWIRYHDQLTAGARALWEKWGVPEFWQDYWKLGYDENHTIWIDDPRKGSGEYHTPTMTIPIFEPGSWQVLNIKHRLLSPPQPGDKYRPERAGLPQAFWVAEPDQDLKGRALVVEGEKKAMVGYLAADDPELRVIGLPAKTIRAGLLEPLRKCEPVYLGLDPDATPAQIQKVCDQLGDHWQERTRLIELPGKIDDLILRYQLGKDWMKALMRTARRAQ